MRVVRSLSIPRLSASIGVGASKIIFAGYLSASIIAYIIIKTHIPMTLYPGAGGDDGLFMTLGRYLADGNWLGAYDQRTLMKGPGYPAFLAVAQWSGLPISLAHALFHCFSIIFFVAIGSQFIKSRILSGLLFTLLLWHPISLSAYLARVLREQIYYGQVLIILAAFLAIMFCSWDRCRQWLVAAFGGAIFGWYWLTREEGIWIVPAIVIIVGIGGWNAFRSRRLSNVLTSIAILLCIFTFIQIGYRTANLVSYGRFVGVEVKEQSFLKAFGAINSVRSGGNKPFISVTASARERIYAVSPAFASLKDFMESSVTANIINLTCHYYQSSCGEIAGGWFIWALRDAVAEKGYFSSPKKAAAFFEKLADEIETACKRGALECLPQSIAEMPQVSWAELAQRFPGRYSLAGRFLLFSNPPTQFSPSIGTVDEIERASHFLNRPLYSRSQEAFDTRYNLLGWFYKSGRDWMSVEVRRPDGSPAYSRLSRTSSPDIQAAFKDPDASDQRFVLETMCDKKCDLVIRTREAQGQKAIGDFRSGTAVKMNGGTFYVDMITETDPFAMTRIETLCDRIRTFVVSHFLWLSVPAFVAGVLCFLFVSVFYGKIAVTSVCYIMALVSWLLVILRVTLLTLIDASSFPAMDPLYLTPAYFLLMSGAVFSSAALLDFTSSANCKTSPR